MNSSSPLYQLLLVLVSFGGFSCMLAFCFLLPGVGNWLAGVFTLAVGDAMLRKRKNDSVWETEP